VSQRHQLEVRLGTLRDIGAIMRSLKTLAMLETRKLGRFIHSQKQVVQAVERAAACLLAHYPRLRRAGPDPPTANRVTLVLGSERGFCGDYNRSLVELLEPMTDAHYLAVGRRLWPHLEGRNNVRLLEGANAAEEIGAVLRNAVQVLHEIAPDGAIRVIFHDLDRTRVRQVMPAFTEVSPDSTPYPPHLHLKPAVLWGELTERYLASALHEMFYSALLTENQRRLQHLEGALSHLEDQTDKLAIRSNTLRQEEITEELQVIMLNFEPLTISVSGGANAPPPGPPTSSTT
jgi:F-type H+-transporting ATPase subunit gamma